VDKYSRINEMLSGTSSTSEQQQKQVRDAVWQRLIDENLFIKNANAAGLYVGKAELKDLVSGENISPVIASLFTDGNGNFSSESLTGFLQSVEDGDENSKAIWNYLQEAVVTNQYYNKYNTLFANSNIENAIQVNRTIADNNTTADVDFVMVPFTYAQDSTVVVTDKEINDFYNNHKRFFEQKASRDIEYVVFEVVPSAADIEAANNDFVKLYNEFASTDNVRSFLQRNSDVQWSDRWYKEGDLRSVNADLDKFVAENNEGTSPVISANNVFYAGRIMASASMPESVTVRHMMFQSNEDGQHLADSLLGELKKGADFTALAQQYSVDRGSEADGEFGKIGEISQATISYLPTGFDAIFTAKVGQPFILQSNIATHIVEVTEAAAPALYKQVALFQKEVISSKETFNKYYNDANRVATLAGGKLANYRAACDSIGVYSHTQNITESTDSYGSIGHAKEVTRWAFDNKPGKVSNIITVDNNYFFVVAVKDAHKEGIAPVSEVASQIKNQLYIDKYAEKRKAEVAEKIAGLTDLEAIAEKLGTAVNTQNDVAFASMNARSLDPKFVGAIAAAPEGKLCGPVAGAIGTYVFKVTGRETGSFYTESDAKNANAQIMNYNIQNIVNVMMQDAGVKDNRARFF
ncbi:MAG: peptidylprolyl isomerase, partial [Bacteroidales bacterium]|nr:peptidylprolyl isomerase [Bacteroidales bacterium]